jgi:hypothetical protein
MKWLNMRGTNKCKDLITSIDESLFLDYSSCTWWIDSGATIHVMNFLQGLSMRRTLPKGERRIRVANGEEAKVEAIGELPLEISNNFTLYLHDILYMSSMRRNLISIPSLDDDGFDYLFGNRQCLIIFNDEVVGHAFRHDKLYLLLIKYFINVIRSENDVNVSSSKNMRKRIDDISSKIWHRIFRGWDNEGRGIVPQKIRLEEKRIYVHTPIIHELIPPVPMYEWIISTFEFGSSLVAPNVNEAPVIQEPKVPNVIIDEEEDQPQNLENNMSNQENLRR